VNQVTRPAPICIRVDGPAPAKDGARSIRGADHPHAGRVQALRKGMAEAMVGRLPLEGGPVRLEMHVFRHACRSDALNLINGVADIIQRRCHRPEHAHDVWVLDDDVQIREFAYRETPAEFDAYELVFTPV
jgi:hypothetical protein